MNGQAEASGVPRKPPGLFYARGMTEKAQLIIFYTKLSPGAAGQSGKTDKTIDFRSNIDDLFIIACYNLQALTRRELKVIV